MFTAISWIAAFFVADQKVSCKSAGLYAKYEWRGR